MFFFFFFSSRRRHTRLTCDWSSDVCSSDLASALEVADPTLTARGREERFRRPPVQRRERKRELSAHVIGRDESRAQHRGYERGRDDPKKVHAQSEDLTRNAETDLWAKRSPRWPSTTTRSGLGAQHSGERRNRDQARHAGLPRRNRAEATTGEKNEDAPDAAHYCDYRRDRVRAPEAPPPVEEGDRKRERSPAQRENAAHDEDERRDFPSTVGEREAAIDRRAERGYKQGAGHCEDEITNGC